MDFDEIAEQQDWTNDSMLYITRGFIAKMGQSEQLAEYAAEIAADENREAGID